MIDTSNVSWPRLALAAVAGFAVLAVLDFVIHAVILMPSYEAYYEGIAREPETMPFWPGMIRLAAWAGFGTWIYTFGVHPGYPGWLQGLRFGFYLGLFWWTAYAFLEFAILPIPFILVPLWIGLGVAQMTLAGTVIGTIYRTKAQSILGAEL